MQLTIEHRLTYTPTKKNKKQQKMKDGRPVRRH